jgi:uncharacterized protein YprB with RNaseH-like and TPR domain
MIPESRRKKLELLTRSIAKGDFTAASKLLQEQAAAPARQATAPARPLPLAEACPGVEATLGRETYWLIRRDPRQVGEEALRVACQYAAVMRGARQRFDELEASPALCRAADARPEDVLFLDIETCGFAGTGVFLIGTMLFAEDRLVVEQHLARTYAEESAILRAFADRCEQAGLLVTFNGKAFDMNMIRERSAFHAIELPDRLPPHLDLLHESRRLWRGRVPNHRLQTLERHFCRRTRTGDIPSAAVPDAYHRFVDTADARELREIVHHNLMDLLTMVELLCAALTGCQVEET